MKYDKEDIFGKHEFSSLHQTTKYPHHTKAYVLHEVKWSNHDRLTNERTKQPTNQTNQTNQPTKATEIPLRS